MIMKTDIVSVLNRICSGGEIQKEEAQVLIDRDDTTDIEELVHAGQTVVKHFAMDVADMCTLINAKSGACAEDCRFCAQSEHYRVGVEKYPLLSTAAILERAKHAESFGAHRFCIVTSGGSLSDAEFQHVLDAYKAIRSATALDLDGSLGLLGDDRIRALREVGVTRVNHNLETSREFFPHVCSTHSFDERYDTVRRLKQAGLEVCCGGIIGLGESRTDRISLAFSLKELGVESIPINILNPRPGTPFEHNERLTPAEIIKTIALFRLINPRAVIKIAGGREVNLGTHQERALRAGANGIIIGGYLTTQGDPVQKDIELLRRAGLQVS